MIRPAASSSRRTRAEARRISRTPTTIIGAELTNIPTRIAPGSGTKKPAKPITGAASSHQLTTPARARAAITSGMPTKPTNWPLSCHVVTHGSPQTPSVRAPAASSGTARATAPVNQSESSRPESWIAENDARIAATGTTTRPRRPRTSPMVARTPSANATHE